jgi:hypothetical protein
MMNSSFLSKLSVGAAIALVAAVIAVIFGVLGLDLAEHAGAALSAVASAFSLVMVASQRRRLADPSRTPVGSSAPGASAGRMTMPPIRRLSTRSPRSVARSARAISRRASST